jgi:hypothetical protein
MTADWDAVAATVAATDQSPRVIAMVSCVTTPRADAGGNPVESRVLLMLSVRVLSRAPCRGGPSFPVELPHTPFDLDIALAGIVDELARRNLTLGVAGGSAGDYTLAVFPMPDELSRAEALERLAALGRVISVSTWSAYVTRGQAPPPIDADAAHPRWTAASIDDFAARPKRGGPARSIKPSDDVLR